MAFAEATPAGHVPTVRPAALEAAPAEPGLRAARVTPAATALTRVSRKPKVVGLIANRVTGAAAGQRATGPTAGLAPPIIAAARAEAMAPAGLAPDMEATAAGGRGYAAPAAMGHPPPDPTERARAHPMVVAIVVACADKVTVPARA